MKNYDLSLLTEKEKLYITTDYQTITTIQIIGRYFVGVFIVLISSFFTPSAEGKVPFANYFSTTKKRRVFTKYRKAVIKKLENNNDEKNQKILYKLNSSIFILDEQEEDKLADKNIEEIYAEYMREHQNDSTESNSKT